MKNKVSRYQDISMICKYIGINKSKNNNFLYYVKFTDQQSFKTRFQKGELTYSRQGVNPRHQTPQGNFSNVIMSEMASQITGVTIIYSNRLFRYISKKISKLCVTGLCEGNSSVTGEFPTQRASDAENESIWWRHHEISCKACNSHAEFPSKEYMIQRRYMVKSSIQYFKRRLRSKNIPGRLNNCRARYI